MAQVRALARRTIPADPGTVLAALADYREIRPSILTEHYRDYRVEVGGEGAGTVVHWVLQATSKRQRDQLVEVSTVPEGVVETDRNSSMVTTWRVRPEGPDSATVEVDTRWDGAGGIGGFFERTFAPKGLQRIHDGVLANLERRVAAGGRGSG
jgi:Polyketide cyclase / dehydrase and lipid transport